MNMYNICKKVSKVQQSVILRLLYTVTSCRPFSHKPKYQCYLTSSKSYHTSLFLNYNKRTFCNQVYSALDQDDNSDTSDDEIDNQFERITPRITIKKGDEVDDKQIKRRKAHAESKISRKLIALASESDWTPELHWEDSSEYSQPDRYVKGGKTPRYKFTQMEDYVPNKVNNDRENEPPEIKRRSLLGQKVTSDHAISVIEKFNKKSDLQVNASNNLRNDAHQVNNINGKVNTTAEEISVSNEVETVDGTNDDNRPLASPQRDLSHIRPVRPSRSYNLAVYVNDSETLTNLVKLGVDLSKIEKDTEIASFIARLKWEEDVIPYINFLRDINVSNEDLCHIISQNPAILQESLEDLQIRVNYFESKKFSLDNVARIITDAPKIFSMTVIEIDKQLGFLQRKFTLTGNEVRFVITRYPKLILKKQTFFEAVIITLQEELGFTDTDQKKLLLAWPKLYVTHVGPVSDTFEYLHNEMGISHSDIMVWPNILTTRVHRIKERHEFLLLVDRAQYNPKKENFVSLKTLATGTDSEFCSNVAKVPIQKYNDFLKTL